MAERLTGAPLRWLTDFQDCVEGEHGDWWQERADEAMEQEVNRPDGGNDGRGWERWRDVRQSEHPSAQALRALVGGETPGTGEHA